MVFPDRIRRNGTFSTQRTGLNHAHRLIVSLLVFGCIGLSIVWFVFVSGHWTVTEIQVSELRTLSREEVASTTYAVLDSGKWNPWDRRNNLLIEEDVLAAALKDRLFAESVTVEKIYPNILRLKIRERQRSVVLSSKDQLLNIDTQGIVTSEATEPTASHIRDILGSRVYADSTYQPVIVCELPELATIGYQVTRPETVRVWLDAYASFLSHGLRFSYLSLDTPTAVSLKIRSEKGYRVIFDLTSPLEPQIETYKKFIQAKPKNANIAEYVDVRVPGKVYFQ